MALGKGRFSGGHCDGRVTRLGQLRAWPLNRRTVTNRYESGLDQADPQSNNVYQLGGRHLVHDTSEDLILILTSISFSCDRDLLVGLPICHVFMQYKLRYQHDQWACGNVGRSHSSAGRTIKQRMRLHGGAVVEDVALPLPNAVGLWAPNRISPYPLLIDLNHSRAGRHAIGHAPTITGVMAQSRRHRQGW